MELSEPTTTTIMGEQDRPDTQSGELGFQAGQHTIADQLQALSVHPREEEGDCNGSKEEVCCEEDEVEINFDDDVDEKQLTDVETASVENLVVIGNGDGYRHENGEGRDVELKTTVNSTRPKQFPERPGAESVKVKEKAKDESSEKAAKIDCKGEKKCPYYMRNGSCKYALTCHFNHPDPKASERPVYRNGETVASQACVQKWSPPSPMNDTASYVRLLYPPAKGVSSNPEWNGYGASFHPYAVNSPLLEANIYAQQPQMPVDDFPERPGQPLCSFYLRMGDCKYKSACKFHHPKNRIYKSPSCALTNFGLPLRPDQSICSHYSRYGICKFGPACKHDHTLGDLACFRT